MRSIGRARLSIRTGLVAGVVALVLITASLVHLPWLLTARAGVTHLTETLNAALIETANARMSGLLDDAVVAQRVIGETLSSPTFDLDDPAAIEALFRSLMESRPELSAIELGWLDDRSYALRRTPEGAVEVLVSPSADHYSISSQYWFKQAFEIEGQSWSDIYRLAGSNAPGFTVLSQVTRDGDSLGVLGVSLELANVSAFLGQIKASPNGAVFLTNGYRERVAVQNEERLATNEAGIPKLEESRNPAVRAAADALRLQAVDLQDLRGIRQFTAEAPGGPYIVTLAPLTQMGLVVGLAVPESDILGPINANTRRLGFALLGFTAVIALLVALTASRTLGKPLIAVTENARLLGDLRLDEIRPVSSRLSEIGTLTHAIGQMSASLASFKKYIPTEVVRALLAQGTPAELGGEHRTLSIFFMDLVNFTRLSEALGDALIPFLGEYLSAVSDQIKADGGVVDKYIGDAVMAFWGAPLPRQDHALAACLAALNCQAKLAELRLTRRESFQARIGINTGRVLVGNVGSRDRLNYTVIGDPVNVASRLESLNKRFGTEIIIGEDTYAVVKQRLVARCLDRVAVYGKRQGQEIYELLCRTEDASPDVHSWIAAYERGLAAFRARAWDEAEAAFSRVPVLRGVPDRPSAIMIQRIAEFRTAPPPADWDACLALSAKG